jgi:hypothetical protein
MLRVKVITGNRESICGHPGAHHLCMFALGSPPFYNSRYQRKHRPCGFEKDETILRHAAEEFMKLDGDAFLLEGVVYSSNERGAFLP